MRTHSTTGAAVHVDAAVYDPEQPSRLHRSLDGEGWLPPTRVRTVRLTGVIQCRIRVVDIEYWVGVWRLGIERLLVSEGGPPAIPISTFRTPLRDSDTYVFKV